MKTLKVRWVHRFEQMTGACAMALYWQNEIAIDLQYAGTLFGQKILEHELNHFHILNCLRKKVSLPRWILTVIKNNLWDIVSVFKIKLLYGTWQHVLLTTLELTILSFFIGFMIGTWTH